MTLLNRGRVDVRPKAKVAPSKVASNPLLWREETVWPLAAISRVFAASSQVATKVGTVKKSGKKRALRMGERRALKQT